MTASRDQRRQHARQRAVEMQCRPIALPHPAGDQPHWLVASTSVPGQAYLVTKTGQRLVCDCPAGARSLPCCHAAAVDLLLHPDLRPASAGAPGRKTRRRPLP